MNISKKTLIALAGCALASVSVAMAPAHAQEVNGWNYAIDSFNDGSELGRRGANSIYEFYGLAIKETADRVYVGLNSNMSLGGQYYNPAADDYIHYGDLFFNFTGDDLAGAEGNLFAIKFDAGNDSGVSETGVYGNVFSKNVAAQNSGFDSMNSHRNWANNGGTASMGGLDHQTQMSNGDYYFQQGKNSVSTSIQSGVFLGGIERLDGGALTALGLNFQSVNAAVQGTHTFGFSFARDLMIDGEYVAHLFAECINDGIAIAGSLTRVEIPDPIDPAAVPEPALATGLFLVGGLGLLKSREKKTANA